LGIGGKAKPCGVAHEKELPEGSNMKAPWGVNIPLGPLLFIFAKELILEIFKLESFLKQKRPFNHSSGKEDLGFRD
jgi:hypothetical protein